MTLLSSDYCSHLMPGFLCRACHPELNRPSMYTGRVALRSPAATQAPRRGEPTATFAPIERYRPTSKIARYKPKES